MKTAHYDAAIIGAGQGGSLAKHLALAGWHTALIERRWPGGSCINWGCTPTKTMIASARIAHLVRQAGKYGVITTPPHIDFDAIKKHKRQMVEDFRGDYQNSISGVPGLDFIEGEAHFEAAKTVMVDLNNGGHLQIHADTIVIATGSCPAIPDIDGLRECPYLTPESLMEVDPLPSHLLILGGGYIAVEFAQMFRRFGSQVTIVQRNSQLLPREDADIAKTIKDIFEEDGINVLLNCHTQNIRYDNSSIALTFDQNNQQKEISGTHLLIATGHTPNTKLLDLPKGGIEIDDKSYICTDGALTTSAPGVYALGDVKGGPAFTHIAYDDTRILRHNLLQNEKKTIYNRIVPYTIFIDPQLGRAGMTEKEARQEKIPIRVASLALDQTARGLESGETRGMLKAIVHAENQLILGAAILAPEGGEVMATLQLAIQMRLPYTAIRDAIFAHPTLVESLNNLFLQMDRQ